VRAYNTLLKAVQDANIFRRNKRPLRSKVVACLLYLSGLSYRAMTYQTGLIGASHVSVFRRVHAVRRIMPRVPKRERKLVAMDETKLKINGRHVFVWAAIDVDTKELLAVYASYYRSHISTIAFVRRVWRPVKGGGLSSSWTEDPGTDGLSRGSACDGSTSPSARGTR
jgi:putative transposase